MEAVEQALGSSAGTLLADADLGAYQAHFTASGYTRASDLLEAALEVGVEQLIQGSEMKKPEAKRLCKALSALAASKVERAVPISFAEEGVPPAGALEPEPEASHAAVTPPRNASAAQGSPTPPASPAGAGVAVAGADAEAWNTTGAEWGAPPQEVKITERIQAESLRNSEPQYHLFLGHRQVGGGAQVGELDTLLQQLLSTDGGMQAGRRWCWRDLSQQVQDLDAMIRGVAQSSVYLLYLTRDALSYYVTIEARAAMMLEKPLIVLMENDSRKDSYAGGKVELAVHGWPADLQEYFQTGRFVAWGGQPFEWSLNDQVAKLKTILQRCAEIGPSVPSGGISWADALKKLDAPTDAAQPGGTWGAQLGGQIGDPSLPGAALLRVVSKACEGQDIGATCKNELCTRPAGGHGMFPKYCCFVCFTAHTTHGKAPPEDEHGILCKPCSTV